MRKRGRVGNLPVVGHLALKARVARGARVPLGENNIFDGAIEFVRTREFKRLAVFTVERCAMFRTRQFETGDTIGRRITGVTWRTKSNQVAVD